MYERTLFPRTMKQHFDCQMLELRKASAPYVSTAIILLLASIVSGVLLSIHLLNATMPGYQVVTGPHCMVHEQTTTGVKQVILIKMESVCRPYGYMPMELAKPYSYPKAKPGDVLTCTIWYRCKTRNIERYPRKVTLQDNVLSVKQSFVRDICFLLMALLLGTVCGMMLFSQVYARHMFAHKRAHHFLHEVVIDPSAHMA